MGELGMVKCSHYRLLTQHLISKRRITKGCTRSTHSGGCEVDRLLFVPGEPRRYSAIMLNMFFGDFKMSNPLQYLIDESTKFSKCEEAIKSIVEKLESCSRGIDSLGIKKLKKSIEISFVEETRKFKTVCKNGKVTILSSRYRTGWFFDSEGNPIDSTIEETLVDMVSTDFQLDLTPNTPFE